MGSTPAKVDAVEPTWENSFSPGGWDEPTSPAFVVEHEPWYKTINDASNGAAGSDVSWDSLPVPGFPPTLADEHPNWIWHWNPPCTSNHISKEIERYEVWRVCRDRNWRWNARKRLALALQQDPLADLKDDDCPLEDISRLFEQAEPADASS